MKICLISPPYNSAVKSIVGVTSPPLGLAYLASMVRKEHEVKIIDANVLDYTMENVRSEIENFSPDLVGITSVTPSIPQAYAVARIAKETVDCTVVIGGPHASFLPVRTLKECGAIDAVVRGEGEKTFEKMVSALEKGRPLAEVGGIVCRNGGRIIDSGPGEIFENVDEIPFPSQDLLPLDRYQFDGQRYTAMLSSRGCPFGCSFCASSRLFGGRWRGRSPENVLEEMRTVYEDYGIQNIEFVDDTFTLDRRRAESICDGIIREGWDLKWGASSRVDTLSRQLLMKMKRAGCWLIYLGIESGSQKVLETIGKRITLDQVRRAVRMVNEAGIEVLGSFIIGFPQDTEKTVKETIRFAKKLNLDYAQFSVLTPYPGTPVYDEAKEEGALLTEDWSGYTAIEPVMRHRDLPPDKLNTFIRRAYVSFYLRPRILMRWFARGQLTLIRRAVRGAIGYLRGDHSEVQADFSF